jgi:asparaginyl-tRNA synthetase
MITLDEPTRTATDQLPPAKPTDHLDSPVTHAALRIQQRLIATAREHLTDAGFMELLPPIIGPVTDPGSRGSKQVDVDFYGHRYKLMTSAILYKQAAIRSFGKIFFIAPNVRLEPLDTASTARHLVEFHQIDVEVPGASRDDAMAVAEGLLTAVLDEATSRLGPEFDVLGRDPMPLRKAMAGPFARYTHGEARTRLAELGHEQAAGAEIDWAAEALLSSAHEQPFFVTEYPKGSRGFYDRAMADRPDVLQSFDLLAPEGYGELCSGSAREYDYGRIITRLRETAENPAKYAWYLDMVREGIPASAGFGLGVERLTRYVAGLHSAWQACAFPKLPGVPTP